MLTSITSDWDTKNFGPNDGNNESTVILADDEWLWFTVSGMLGDYAYELERASSTMQRNWAIAHSLARDAKQLLKKGKTAEARAKIREAKEFVFKNCE